MQPIEIIDNFLKTEKLEFSKLSIGNFIGYKILPDKLNSLWHFNHPFLYNKHHMSSQNTQFFLRYLKKLFLSQENSNNWKIFNK